MPILRYRKSLDSILKSAVQTALSVRVFAVSKIKQGEVNHVYKVFTGRGNVLVRVFRHKDWPEDGKLQWIEKQFRKYGIPHAKMLFYDRTEKFFPNGFMISEYIEGKSAAEAIKRKELSVKKFYFENAKLLKKVHRVRCKRFGSWSGNKLGTEPKFLSFYLPRIKQRIARFKKTEVYEKDLSEKIEHKIIELLKPIRKKLEPVLTHGDPGRDNCIWSEKQGLILIDWDNASASVWLRDYADMMYWELYSSQFNKTPKARVKNAAKAFLEGYGRTEFNQAEIEQIKSALFIIQAVDLLPYYYFDQRNMSVFRKTWLRLQTLLTTT